MEQEQLGTLTNIINRSQDMCPVCKELFDRITWELMQEFEKVLSKKRKKREIKMKSGSSNIINIS